MNAYLETGIAVALVFFIFSIVAYVLHELIAINLKFRGRMLQQSIEQLLNATNLEEQLADKFFNHPQVKLLQKRAGAIPSYIPSSNFAMAVMDLVVAKADNRTGDLYHDFKAGLEKFTNSGSDLPTLLKNILQNSDNLEQLKGNIEKWFNEYMDRVSGWYKSKATFFTRIIAIVIALCFNVDIIRITHTIYGDSQLRATLVATAERMVDKPDVVKEYYKDNLTQKMNEIDSIYKQDTVAKTPAQIDSLKKKKDSTQFALLTAYDKQQIGMIRSLVDSVSSDKLVFGWPHNPFKVVTADGSERCKNGWEVILMFLGIFLGAAGISMGAPFWFDMMSKLVNVRRAGLKPVADDTQKKR